MSTLDNMIIAGRCRMTKAKENFREFWSSEKGVSNVVATIIILLIVVLLIGFFWEELQKWLDKMMDTIFGTEFDSGGLSGVTGTED